MFFGFREYEEPDAARCSRAGVFRAYRDVSLEAIREKFGGDYPDWMAKIIHYINNIEDAIKHGVNLLLAGPHASGKTALGCILVKQVIGRGGIATLVNGDKLPGISINDPMYDEDYTWKQRLFNQSHLVVVDEVYVSDTRISDYVERFLRARQSIRKSTVVTTNTSWETMADIRPALCSVLQRHFTSVQVSAEWTAESREKNDSFFEGVQ